MTQSDNYWSNIIPQSRYRRLDKSESLRKVDLDIYSWESCETAEKKQLKQNVLDLYWLIQAELLGETTVNTSEPVGLESLLSDLGLDDI